MDDIERITPERLARRLRGGESVSVLDVRDRDEFDAWHIDGRNVTAAHVPHLEFLQAKATGADPRPRVPDGLGAPLVVVCARGEASDEVATMLTDHGLSAANLAGGMEAWAQTLLWEPVPTDGSGLTIRQYQRPSSGCLSYLVTSENEAAVIDPLRAFVDRYVSAANELGVTLRYAVDTHVHADHVSGVRALADRTAASVVVPAGAKDRGLAFDAELIGNGETLDIGKQHLEAIRAPGHTSESMIFRLDAADGFVFTADTLFLRSVGRPDLEAGDENVDAYAARLHETLQERVLSLPTSTTVLPGHFADLADAASPDPSDLPAAEALVYAAPLASLRTLPVLGMDQEAFVDWVNDRMPPQPANYERIIRTNLGQKTLTDDAAFEAELGPNNCAVSAD